MSSLCAKPKFHDKQKLKDEGEDEGEKDTDNSKDL